MSLDGSYNFRRINDRVTTSGVVGAERLGALQASGYQALINLLPDSSEYAVAGEADLVTAQGVDYIYIPVDFAAPSQQDFDAFTRAMDQLDDRKVHIHCAANFRVSAFYSLYAQRCGRWNTAQADAHIRDLWNPADEPAWAAFIASQRQNISPG